MTGAAARQPEVPRAARHSLRVRLPLLITGLLLATIAIFLWAAYREVEATLIRAGLERARIAADQVASLLRQPTAAGMDNFRRMAAETDIRRYLQAPADASRDAAVRARMAALGSPTVPRRIELWSEAGERLMEISLPPTTPRPDVPAMLPPVASPPRAGLSGFQPVDNVVFYDAVAEILDDAPPADQATAAPVRLGHIVVRSIFSVNPPGIIGRLVGGDAVVAIGNTTGGIWTDLSRQVAAPPVDASQNGVAEYRSPNGERRLGSIATVGGTPWAVSAEFPRAAVVAPARVFLRRMIMIALLVVAIGAVVVGQMTIRITRPLRDLARAAGEIAAGDYSRTVPVARSDEIGALASAFNGMVADVKDAQQQLEARVLERGQALEALRKSETHYRAIVEVALDCIITIDAAGRVVEFNPAAEQTFGYLKHEVSGRELADLIVPPALRESHRRGLAHYVATGQSRLIGQLIEMTAMRSDGTEFPVELAISAVPSDPPMLTGVLRNITERKRAEDIRLQNQTIEERHRRIVEANRLKSEFLANMSHELRTPLNAIIGFAELMHNGKVGPVSADHKEYLGDILTSSRHLLQLINDVLDLAKVEAGKMEFRPEPVNLDVLVGEVRDIVRGLAASQGLRVETEVDPDVAAVVIDPSRVKQVLYNFLSNAIKFTPEGGRVSVRIVPEGPAFFRIDVEDTGVGISSADLPRLFVEFQQLDAGRAKKYQGTGLGLALTKRLVEAHGGRVAVRSAPGVGSIFSAILPRVMTIAPADIVIPIVGSPGDHPLILVVDDDAATLKLAGAALSESGYRPVCTATAAEALLAVEIDRPAVVIVDLLMPGMDGFAFIERLRGMPAGRHVPVIVWTVKDLEADERVRLQSLAAFVLPKRAGGSQALVEELGRILPAGSLATSGSPRPPLTP